MSLFDYEASRGIAEQDHPFYALIMAAMRKADTENLHKLRQAFPHTHHELMVRYHAPGGRLDNE